MTAPFYGAKSLDEPAEISHKPLLN